MEVDIKNIIIDEYFKKYVRFVVTDKNQKQDFF